MNKSKYIVALAVFIILVATAIYLNPQIKQDELLGISITTENNSQAQETDVAKVDSFEPANVPVGWKTYSSAGSRWQVTDTDIAFAYPPNWDLEERLVTRQFVQSGPEETRIEFVILTGDGYLVTIHQKAKDSMTPYSSTKKIGGYDARIWESKDSFDGVVKYNTMIGGLDAGFIISIRSTDGVHKLPEEMLSTINFKMKNE